MNKQDFQTAMWIAAVVAMMLHFAEVTLRNSALMRYLTVMHGGA